MSDKQYSNIFPDKDKILEYLRGGLTSRERNRIEKLILENDFFKDVVEGLESENPDLIQQDLMDLGNAIKSRTHLSNKHGFNIYKLAATISLLVMASAIIYFLITLWTHPGPNEQVSLNQSNEFDTVKTEIKDIPHDEETIEHNEPDLQETPTFTERRTEPVKKIQSISQGDKIEKTADSIEIMENKQLLVDNKQQVDKSAVIIAESADEELADNINMEKDVTNDRDDRVAFPEVSVQKAGNEVLESTKKQRKELSGRAVPAIASKLDPVENQPVPVIGFDNYRKYLEDSLQFPQSALDNQIEGVVVVNFTIDKDSIPHNITCIQSLGYGCEEEAFRLIREGPKWSPITIDGKIVEADINVNIEFNLPHKR